MSYMEEDRPKITTYDVIMALLSLIIGGMFWHGCAYLMLYFSLS